MSVARSRTVSSFTIIKGSLIEETYSVFQQWDFAASRKENLQRMKDGNTIGATSQNWLRDVAKVLNRRFEPDGRDRALVELAQAGCDPAVWRPILLWHMTRDEFLLRDFLINWLYPRHVEGAYRLLTDDVVGYLKLLPKKKGIEWSGSWAETTTSRVAAGLLRMAGDFGLLTGSVAKEFASYHLPDESLLYLLHAIGEGEPNAARLIASSEWRMYLMDATDVERELLRLHQFHRLHYQAAGSLVQLKLPYADAADYAKQLAS